MLSNYDKIKQIQKLNEEELKYDINPGASWHNKYKDSAYIYIGNFPFEITEGDLVIVFSQYGEIVDCRIIRDKDTGKSKGFGFICYENQLSTILAVDNLNGTNIGGRMIRVDHVEQYKIPKEYFEIDENDEDKIYKPTGPDGKGWGQYRILSEEDKEMFEQIKKEQETSIKKTNDKFLNDDIEIDNEKEWEQKFIDLVNKEKEKIEKKHNKRIKKDKSK